VNAMAQFAVETARRQRLAGSNGNRSKVSTSRDGADSRPIRNVARLELQPRGESAGDEVGSRISQADR